MRQQEWSAVVCQRRLHGLQFWWRCPDWWGVSGILTSVDLHVWRLVCVGQISKGVNCCEGVRVLTSPPWQFLTTSHSNNSCASDNSNVRLSCDLDNLQVTLRCEETTEVREGTPWISYWYSNIPMCSQWTHTLYYWFYLCLSPFTCKFNPIY